MKKLMGMMALALAVVAMPTSVEATTYTGENQVIESKASEGESEFLNLKLSTNVTLMRGFQIIDGNIYDRYGNLHIELDENGRTADGFGISPTFSIVYYDDLVAKYGNSVFDDSSAYDAPMSRTVLNIYNATMTSVPLNTTGHQAVNLGGQFSLENTNTRRRVEFRYISGAPTSVNVGIRNLSLDREEGILAHVTPGSAWATIPGVSYSAATSGNSYQARVSANGQSGPATMHLRTRS